MTAQDLANYVGDNVGVSDYITDCWNTAVVLVDNFVTGAAVPTEVLDRAYLIVGAEMYHQKSAPQGVSQFTDYTGANFRVARDPMIPAYPLLAAWVVGF